MKKEKQLNEPTFVVRHNKHHVREFYILPTKDDFVNVKGISDDTILKRVGPAIVEVTQFGIQRKIVKHKLNAKSVWNELGDLITSGLWALNNRQAVKIMPKDLSIKSKRFSETR